MKRILLVLFIALSSCVLVHAEVQKVEKPIVFRGDTLQLNEEFKRSMPGTTPTSVMPEISGMSCSRVTPGYLWVQSDENYRVTAITEKGDVAFMRIMTNRPTRRDWEGLGIGIYQGKSTVFVGGFGDNNLQYKDKYYIFYFEEPAIPAITTPGTYTKDTFNVGNQYILYGYPDGKAHNTEALMYDNLDQKLYIIDKVGHSYCSVFSLRMDTVYGTNLQILTKECDLGIEGEDQFQLVTAADITPDGRWIIIKNYDVTREKAYALLWERFIGETVTEALLRQPEQIAAYQLEWQGEAVAWLDSTTFYTTSDEDSGRAPIYKYVRWNSTGMEQIKASDNADTKKIYINGQIYIRTKENDYTLTGQLK